MTYFIVFQFCFMVLGQLYATWRVVLAIGIMLLYSVAALDRSLLLAVKVGRSPRSQSSSKLQLAACLR